MSVDILARIEYFDSVMNVLTFDIEDWFHIRFDDSFTTDSNYSQFQGRVEKGLHELLDILDVRSVQATFLCLGWLAEKYPHLIKEIDKRGHEIGSHTHMHKLSKSHTPASFKSDLNRSCSVLGDITGSSVKVFRAPSFSIGPNEHWVFEVLAEVGIEIDLSIFPINRGNGGYEAFSNNQMAHEPHWLDYRGIKIKEFPMSPVKIFGQNYIFSGGGYFRLLPYHILKKFFLRNHYNMAYFHIRDFDPDQPKLEGLSLFQEFKSYYGLSRSMAKFELLINDFEFISVKKADELIDWKHTKTIKIT